MVYTLNIYNYTGNQILVNIETSNTSFYTPNGVKDAGFISNPGLISVISSFPIKDDNTGDFIKYNLSAINKAGSNTGVDVFNISDFTFNDVSSSDNNINLMLLYSTNSPVSMNSTDNSYITTTISANDISYGPYIVYPDSVSDITYTQGQVTVNTFIDNPIPGTNYYILSNKGVLNEKVSKNLSIHYTPELEEEKKHKQKVWGITLLVLFSLVIIIVSIYLILKYRVIQSIVKKISNYATEKIVGDKYSNDKKQFNLKEIDESSVKKITIVNKFTSSDGKILLNNVTKNVRISYNNFKDEYDNLETELRNYLKNLQMSTNDNDELIKLININKNFEGILSDISFGNYENKKDYPPVDYYIKFKNLRLLMDEIEYRQRLLNSLYKLNVFTSNGRNKLTEYKIGINIMSYNKFENYKDKIDNQLEELKNKSININENRLKKEMKNTNENISNYSVFSTVNDNSINILLPSIKNNFRRFLDEYKQNIDMISFGNKKIREGFTNILLNTNYEVSEYIIRSDINKLKKKIN